MRRRTWLILAIIAIPVWLIGAGGEIADSFLIRKEGVVTTGEINPGEWIRSRGRYYKTEVTYRGGTRELRKEFKIPSAKTVGLVDDNGMIIAPRIDVRYAPSKPQVAELVILPSDSPWISILVASVGFCVIGGIFGYMIYTAKK